MAYRAELKLDSRSLGILVDPQVHQQCDISVPDLIQDFTLDDLKTVFFLLVKDLCNKEALNNYLRLVASEEDYMKSQFFKLWQEHQLCRNDLIELLGTMKKFKLLKRLGICKHIFKKQNHIYKTVPKICKFLYSICEELDDEEVKSLKCNIFPNLARNICGEELICLMLLHEKIRSNDFSQLSLFFLALKREDLVSKIRDFEQQRQKTSSGGFYPIRQPTFENPSGLAVLINEMRFTEPEGNAAERLSLKERKGSEIDCWKLNKLWHDFGFEVETHPDMTASEISRLPEDLACRDLMTYDVFVLCIMSHGNKGIFYSSDSKEISIDSFIRKISDHCMVGKPKLIFVQACQGINHNEGISASECQARTNLEVDNVSGMDMLPRHSDILLAAATIDDFVSYRDQEDGSLFISHLVKNISAHGDKEDIQAVLTRVIHDTCEENARFGEKLFKQQPVVETTLRKNVILKRPLREFV